MATRSSPPPRTRILGRGRSTKSDVAPWLHPVARNHSARPTAPRDRRRRGLDGRAPLRGRPDHRRQGAQARGVPAPDRRRAGPARDAAHRAAAARDRRALLRADRRGDGDHGPVGQVAARARAGLARRGRPGAAALLRRGPRRARRRRRGPGAHDRARPPAPAHVRPLRELPQAAALQQPRDGRAVSRSARCSCSRRRSSPSSARPRPPRAARAAAGAAAPARRRRRRAAGRHDARWPPRPSPASPPRRSSPRAPPRSSTSPARTAARPARRRSPPSPRRRRRPRPPRARRSPSPCAPRPQPAAEAGRKQGASKQAAGRPSERRRAGAQGRRRRRCPRARTPARRPTPSSTTAT